MPMRLWFNLKCPQCGSVEDFDIIFKAEGHVDADGTFHLRDEAEFDFDRDYCHCSKCDNEDFLSQFVVEEE